MREKLIELVKQWTEDNININENFTEWEEFLTEQGYIKTYDQVYDMDLAYLQENKDYQYMNNGEWDVDALINDDNDIEKLTDGLYFVHCQEYIPQYVIDKFYEQQNEKQKQKEIDLSITQSYINLNLGNNGFNRFKDILNIYSNNFGKEILYFCTEMKKVKQELLYCINDVLDLINDIIYDGSIKLWIPNHNMWSNDEDDHYCQLIKFGGYEVFDIGKTILKSNVIILKEEESIQSLDCYTDENMKDFFEYIKEVFEFYIKDCFNVGDNSYVKETNEKLNNIINKYWSNTIEFDYGEFYLNN